MNFLVAAFSLLIAAASLFHGDASAMDQPLAELESQVSLLRSRQRDALRGLAAEHEALRALQQSLAQKQAGVDDTDARIAALAAAITAAKCEEGHAACPAEAGEYDYIVVGAGSAGLQMGLLMQKSGASYVIYERGADAGQFWRNNPVAEELISVNAAHPSERYDWHGLLESPVSFKSVTARYFPLRSDYHAYLNQVAQTLNVVYETEVVDLQEGPCVVLSSGVTKCARRVFVGTGFRQVKVPELDDMGVVHYSAFNRNDVKGEKVCIFGNGNSAWEMAQASYATAESVIVMGRRPTRFSFVTKHVGDPLIQKSRCALFRCLH